MTRSPSDAKKKPQLHCPECGCLISNDYASVDKMRRRYFAILRQGWESLPEHYVRMFPNPEHMRKHCLIKIGYCTEATEVLSSHPDAEKAAALLRANLDDYSIIDASGQVVRIRKAKSQAGSVIKSKQQWKDLEFQVFSLVSAMLGCSVEELESMHHDEFA